MKRGDVFDARLDPTEGSEQAGTRPVVIVSRDAINASSPAAFSPVRLCCIFPMAAWTPIR